MKKELTYEEAAKRLEEIIAKMENGQQEVDTLTEDLKEAKELIALCKKKLFVVEKDIEEIINNQ